MPPSGSKRLEMKTTPEHDARIAAMPFASVYPLYLKKIERKGRTEKELLRVLEWLTGYDEETVHRHINAETTFKCFFEEAQLNPDSCFIKGMICGYRVEEIENPLTRQVRYLDKLVDELARGKKIESIIRSK